MKWIKGSSLQMSATQLDEEEDAFDTKEYAPLTDCEVPERDNLGLIAKAIEVAPGAKGYSEVKFMDKYHGEARINVDSHFKDMLEINKNDVMHRVKKSSAGAWLIEPKAMITLAPSSYVW